MPVFKLWNARREQKKAVIAVSLEELKIKGAAKLGVDYNSIGTEIVLEEDGTQIDDDDVLEEFKTKTLILLNAGERWESPTISLLVAENNFSALDNNMSSSTASSSSSAVSSVSCQESCAMEDAHKLSKDEHCPNQRNVQDHCEKSTSDCKDSDLVTFFRHAPLPTFSPFVMPYLQGAEPAIERVWSSIIDQAAEHYTAPGYPTIQDQMTYRVIGQKMLAKYPSLAQAGKHPWKAFNQSLSQRIRHRRHRQKTKSLGLHLSSESSCETTTPKRKSLSFLPLSSTSSQHSISTEDVERHLKEISEEWKKGPSRNKQHLKKLIHETEAHRRQLLLDSVTGYASIFKLYPCFEEDSYVYQAFVTRCSKQVTDLCAKRLSLLLNCVWQMMGSNVRLEEGEEGEQDTEPQASDFIAAVQNIEKKLRCKTSIIEEVKDVADDLVRQKLNTNKDSPPRLRVFSTCGRINGVFVAGDEVFTQVTECDMWRAILVLFATYYAFDINFPKQYQGVLELMQKFLMQTDIQHPVTQSFTLLVQQLERMAKIKAK